MTARELAGSRCLACASAYVPPRRRCVACGGETEPHAVAGTGVLLTWTRVERPPEGFEAGRVVGVVRLDAGPSCLAEAALGGGEQVELDGAVTVEPGTDGRLTYRSR